MTEKRKVLRWRKAKRERWDFYEYDERWELTYGGETIGTVAYAVQNRITDGKVLGFYWVTPKDAALGIGYRNSSAERRLSSSMEDAKTECEAYIRECLGR